MLATATTPIKEGQQETTITETNVEGANEADDVNKLNA